MLSTKFKSMQSLFTSINSSTRNFNEKLESHRRRFEKQIEELKRDQKQEFQSYNLTMTLKLENVQAENAEWQRKTDEAKETLREMRSNIAKLERNLRR